MGLDTGAAWSRGTWNTAVCSHGLVGNRWFERGARTPSHPPLLPRAWMSLSLARSSAHPHLVHGDMSASLRIQSWINLILHLGVYA